jgi:hypothetical protein
MDEIRAGILRGQTVVLRPLALADAGAIAAAAAERAGRTEPMWVYAGDEH